MPKLYLDLNKAVVPSVTGGVTKKDDQAAAEHDESFNESPQGLSSPGSAQYDNPEVGRKWDHGEGSLDEKLEAKRQARNAESQNRNLTPTKEEIGIKKAFDESSIDMVKSLTSGLRNVLNLNKYNPTETEYLLSKGYQLEEIEKGTAKISGRDRNDFSAWLCQRAAKALDSMYRR